MSDVDEHPGSNRCDGLGMSTWVRTSACPIDGTAVRVTVPVTVRQLTFTATSDGETELQGRRVHLRTLTNTRRVSI